jgi:hypothetical protein
VGNAFGVIATKRLPNVQLDEISSIEEISDGGLVPQRHACWSYIQYDEKSRKKK